MGIQRDVTTIFIQSHPHAMGQPGEDLKRILPQLGSQLVKVNATAPLPPVIHNAPVVLSSHIGVPFRHDPRHTRKGVSPLKWVGNFAFFEPGGKVNAMGFFSQGIAVGIIRPGPTPPAHILERTHPAFAFQLGRIP
jgi:hypothetical protein